MAAPEHRDALRARLVEVASQMLEAGGPEALQARKVTAETGTSTQAIYTHFGGMPGLLQAVIADALNRFADHVRRVPESDDAVADHFARGFLFCEWALTHPEQYRLICGLSSADLRHDPGLDLSPGGDVATFAEGRDAFGVLVGSVAKVVDSGRVRPVNPVLLAGQMLSLTHGWVLLAMAHAFGDAGGMEVIHPLVINVLVGLGDRRRAAEQSWDRALAIVAGLGA